MKLSEKLAAAGDGIDEDDELIEQVPPKVIPRPKPSRASFLGRTGDWISNRTKTKHGAIRSVRYSRWS